MFNEGDSVGSLQLRRWHKPLACGHAEHRPEAYATETLASLNGIVFNGKPKALRFPLLDVEVLPFGELRKLILPITTRSVSFEVAHFQSRSDGMHQPWTQVRGYG